MKNQVLPVMAGIAISFIFGLSFIFTKDALKIIDPFLLLAYRFTIATGLLLLLTLFRLVTINLDWQLIKDLLPLAIFQPVVYFVGETIGVKLTTASESGLVIALIPVVVTLLGAIYLNEKADWRQWLFVFLSVAGVALIILNGFSGKFQGHLIGFIFLLIAVLAAAIYNVLSRKLSAKYSPVEITLVMMATGAIFFNLTYFLNPNNEGGYFMVFQSPRLLVAILYLGILSSVIAFFLLNFMLRKLPAARAATFVNLTTVVTVAAGVLFLNEQFALLHFIGGILILIGVWGSNSLKARDNF